MRLRLGQEAKRVVGYGHLGDGNVMACCEYLYDAVSLLFGRLKAIRI